MGEIGGFCSILAPSVMLLTRICGASVAADIRLCRGNFCLCRGISRLRRGKLPFMSHFLSGCEAGIGGFYGWVQVGNFGVEWRSADDDGRRFWALSVAKNKRL